MRSEISQKHSVLDRIDRVIDSAPRLPWALFLGAFLLKLWYVLQSNDSLAVRVPILDSEYYDTLAQDILEQGVVRQEAYFMGPLYPHFLAVIYGIFGRIFLIVRIVQILGGSLTVVLTYLLGRKLFRPSVAFLGALALVFYGAMTYFEGEMLMMWLGTLINMTMLYVLHRREVFTVKTAALVGFLLGLSALARANILIFYPVIIIWVVFFAGKNRRLPKCAVLTAAVLITISPATIHNYIASRDFVPITSNAGVNFYIGNHERATGYFSPPEGIDFVTDAELKNRVERLLGRRMKPSELSSYWFDQSVEFIKNNPAMEFRIMLRKAALFLNGYEVPQIECFDVVRTRYLSLKVLFINFWILVSLGILGAVYALRGWRKYFLLHGFVFAYALSIIIFFVTARYRAQIAPVLCLFAACSSLEVLPKAFHKGRFSYLPIIALVTILYVTRPALFALPEKDVYWREHIHEARRLSRVGRLDDAIKEIDKAVELHPDYAESHTHRAIIHKEAGKFFQAIADYSKAIKISPYLPNLHYDLAQTLRQVKMYRPAIEEYEMAIELDPLMLEAYNNLGITYRDIGELDEAIKMFEKVIEMDPEYIKAYSNLGSSLAEKGELDSAIDSFRRAIQLNPRYANSYLNLGMAFVQKQRADSALIYLERYVRLNPQDEKALAVIEKLRIVVEGDTLAGDDGR